MSDETKIPQELDPNGVTPEDPKVTAEIDEGTPVNKRGRVILSVLIIILIILLLLACAFLANLLNGNKPGTDETGGVEWIRSIYGWGNERDQLISPTSVDTAASGRSFWITDPAKFRLVEFDWNGKLDQVFEKDADGTIFESPTDLAIAPNGWFYVVESPYNKVTVYDQNKKLQQTLLIEAPMSVDVNDEMVVIGAKDGFAAFDRQGNYIGQVGSFGKGEDQFDTINGVVLDNDSNAYIVDTFNNRLSKYDAQGDRVWMVELGPPGNGGADVRMNQEKGDELKKKYPAMLQVPMGCTIDAAGRIVIIDALDFTISAFDAKDGSFEGKWGQFGSKDGQLAYSSDIQYGNGYDWFVLTDPGNARAQIVRIPGSGGSALDAIRRALAGPLGACCIPLLLIILFTVLYFVWRYIKRRREKAMLEEERDNALQAAKDGASPGGLPDLNESGVEGVKKQ